MAVTQVYFLLRLLRQVDTNRPWNVIVNQAVEILQSEDLSRNIYFMNELVDNFFARNISNIA